MALALSTTSASFFAAVIGSFLYGLFFVLTLLSTGLHIQRIIRNDENISRRALTRCVLRNRMVIAGLTMFLVVTTRWVLDVVYIAYGLLESNEPEVYFLAPVSTPAVIGIGFLAASLLNCDTILVYRLWIVWNKSTAVVIFPCLSLLGLLACGIGVTRQMAITALGENPFINEAQRWITATNVFNLSTNIYSTGMIAFRIHMVNSNPDVARLHGRRDLKSVIAILIESSALAWIVFGMITYATESPLDAFVRATLGTVSGISFMLINVRVSLGWGQTRREYALESSIILASPETPTACSSVRVRIDTQVDAHVEIREKGPGDTDTGGVVLLRDVFMIGRAPTEALSAV
ncbi:hypothetical protein K438DRAFT_1955925 [Mycena galopus ATCC 62051]|nr:hypothetical protein K438DRAFT_1955925 [Mycena galopus ATCC 62051]